MKARANKEEEIKEEPVAQKQVVRIYIEDKTRSMLEPAEEFVLLKQL